MATVLGFTLMAVSSHLDGTMFAELSSSIFEIGKVIGEFGILRKGVVDWEWFGKMKADN